MKSTSEDSEPPITEALEEIQPVLEPQTSTKAIETFTMDEKKPQFYAQNQSFGYIKYISLIVLTVQNAALGLSMSYASHRKLDAKDKFANTAAVLMAEVFKLIICVVIVLYDAKSVKRGISSMYTIVILNIKDTLRVCVPSCLYVIQNNLLYVSVANLDAATYQVTYQLKLLTTALFAVIVLKRKLQRWQWCALGLLVAGVITVQLASNTSKDTKSKVDLENQSRILGFGTALAACFISGFAGIYFEKVLKESDISVWMRNVQLSLLSIPFGVISCAINGSLPTLLQGFDGFVWYLVILQAVGGLIVAIVVKYADNILKGFATSVAIIISCVVAMLVLDFHLTLQFAVGTVLVISSIFLYGYVPKKKERTSLNV